MEYENFKSFRDQLLDCRKDGTLKKEKCIHCSKILLMCYKHGGTCQSKKCLDDRIGEMEEKNKKEHLL